MKRRRTRRLRSLAFYWVVGLAISVVAQGGVSGENLVLDAVTCAVAVVLLGNVHWHLLPRLRRWPLLAVVPISAAIYVGVVVVSITVAITVLVMIVKGSPAQVAHWIGKFFTDNWTALRFPVEIAILISFLGELGRRIGLARIMDLARGRYRNPREETRVFLFIDLRGSTPLAESLGAIRFSLLLRDIFDDLTEPVLDAEGDVVGYVGDEAIISWPFERGIANGNVLRCFQFFKAQIALRSAHYQHEYGLVPRFRAAVHSGPIVATEVGQIRTDVALHGDTLNTVARVLGECQALDAELLITDTVASQLPALSDMTVERLGDFQLRGKEEKVGLSRVTA
jgi:class 3 adenylate cyclase